MLVNKKHTALEFKKEGDGMVYIQSKVLGFVRSRASLKIFLTSKIDGII